MVNAAVINQLVILSSRRMICSRVAQPQGSAKFFVPQDALYRESIPITVIPDICYRESILAFFGWIPADGLRG
jgi:hypothetical protein